MFEEKEDHINNMMCSVLDNLNKGNSINASFPMNTSVKFGRSNSKWYYVNTENSKENGSKKWFIWKIQQFKSRKVEMIMQDNSYS